MQTQHTEFFSKSEYDFIGVEFNFSALAQATSQEFADKIEDEVLCLYIKIMHVRNNFYTFFAENIDKTEYKLITAYCNKEGNYFTVESINSSHLHEMGLKVVGEDQQ